MGRPISGQEGVLKGASPHSYCVRCLLHIALPLHIVLPLHIALHTYGILLPVWCCWTISRGIQDKQELYSVEYCISLHNAHGTLLHIYIVYCIYLQCNVVFQHIGISIVIQKWPHRETCQVWQRRGGHCSNACRFGFLRLIIILLSSCSHHQNHQTGITQFLWKIIMSKQIKLCFSNTHISNSFDY